MTYEEIKTGLHKVGKLVDAGRLAEADVTVRNMVGKGLMPADFDANLTVEQMRALRDFAMKDRQ